MSLRGFSTHLLTISIPLHALTLFGIAAVFGGWVQLQWLPLLIGYVLFSGFGVAIGYHRLLSHRSFKTHRAVEVALSLAGCYAAQGSPLFWKAVHVGNHHPWADQPEDLHSPRRGFWNAFLGWQMFLEPKEVPFIAAKDMLTDPTQIFIHRHYNKIFWTPIVLLLVLSPSLALSLFLLPGVLALHTENFINSVCHTPRFGYRNFATKDTSCNVPLLGWLCFGQGWHNNHHHSPRKFDYGGERWYEIDICAWLIPLIRVKKP